MLPHVPLPPLAPPVASRDHSLVPRLAIILLALAASAQAAIEYRGVNLSAAEFGFAGDDKAREASHIPGIHGADYIYADASHFDYFHGVGMNTFRIPFRWERIQPTLGGALDTDELARLAGVVDYATGLGANVILDVHNYARYYTPTGREVLGTPQLTNADFSNLWSRLGAEFSANERVIFGLMNEPHDMLTETVVSFTNDALTALRAMDVGTPNLVLVQGNGYSGAHSWEQGWYGTPNSVAMLGIQADPNLAFEVHQYVDNNPGNDNDYSGLTDNVESATIAAEKLAGFTDWLRANNLRGFLGEIGTPSSELGVQAMFNGVGFVEENHDVWLGWAVWAGGPWWDDESIDKHYHLSVNPYEGEMAPQLAALQPFLVPEPSTWLLVALGLAVIAWQGRRAQSS